MAQAEQPANLDRWHTPDGRALTLILMRCGLRVGDACHLSFDCIIRDGDGAAYLRCLNRKMKREALVPIDEEAEGEIAAQQQRVLERWPGGSRWLFPAPRMNPDGTRPLTTHSYRGQLDRRLERLGRVTQALPNGYCGLPVQRTCPHAHACLTCPMFVTTPEFLPQHREQRQQLLQIVSAAEARGQARVAEMNRQVLGNLEKIITGLEDDPGQPEVTADAS